MKQKMLIKSLTILAAAAALSSCSGGSAGSYSLGNWEKEASMVAGSTTTPTHALPKSEYPFDALGNYISAWAASGEGRFGKAHQTWAAIIAVDSGDAAFASDRTLRPGH